VLSDPAAVVAGNVAVVSDPTVAVLSDPTVAVLSDPTVAGNVAVVSDRPMRLP
jgi:hypothetical protein